MNTTAKLKLLETIQFIDGAYAPSTIRAYKTNFENFIQFCDDQAITALPASSIDVSNYIKVLTEKLLKSSSIKIAIAAISAIHRLNNLEDPTSAPIVKIEMRRMFRSLGREAKQAYGINKQVLTMMLEATDNSLRGIRDRALLTLAYDTLCRRSEIVSLRIEDISYKEDKLRIKLRKSKTDPHGIGKQLSLSKDGEKYLIDWLGLLGNDHGYIFRGTRGGKIQENLTPAQINRIYKYLAKKSHLDKTIVNQISGHSTRVGAAQDLLFDGATLAMIMNKGRWSKPDTVARYLENAQLA